MKFFCAVSFSKYLVDCDLSLRRYANRTKTELWDKNVNCWTVLVGRQEAEFQNDWIQSHVEASNISIGKPLLVEEFGKKLQETDEDDPEKIASIRNPSYNLTYKLLEDHIQSQSGGFVGTLFWRYYLETYEGQGRSE